MLHLRHRSGRSYLNYSGWRNFGRQGLTYDCEARVWKSKSQRVRERNATERDRKTKFLEKDVILYAVIILYAVMFTLCKAGTRMNEPVYEMLVVSPKSPNMWMPPLSRLYLRTWINLVSYKLVRTCCHSCRCCRQVYIFRRRTPAKPDSKWQIFGVITH